MLDFSGETHPGCLRDNNEDAIGWLPDRSIFMVADGMGGYSSGEIAAQIAKDSILKQLATDGAQLSDALRAAHHEIVAAARGVEERTNMGSTVVVAEIVDRTCRIAWCGDSRAYLWRAGEVSRLTRDHSLLEQQVQAGELTQTQAHQHPDQNILMQALGHNDPIPGEVEVPLRSGDWILLCTDGLHDMLTDRELAGVLRSADTPNQATQALISAALDRGAKDNVSVVAVECPVFDGDPKPAPAESAAVSSRRHLRLTGGAIVGLLALMAIAGALLRGCND